ncbi:Glycosyl transferase, group 1 [Parafrankia sp. Ea1.12]|uniref:glycosyltransferase family 4 protein n=1 Tax=Parafrankia sp. Ea1.12 TaxID=573499 RepID=UPI000DA52BB5|nr:glycosyltransferase family 4 protein [Parafrankia sp. Ea1.12]SQD97035.1 Glycosyl transferase, group 1 [Parafrankia sp. Ea1.12]
MALPPAAARVAVVLSNPIQHFAPFYSALAERDVDLRVLFMSRAGLDQYLDPNFGVEIQWGSAVTSGYSHEFVADLEVGPDWKHPRPCQQAVRKLVRRLDRLQPDCVLVHGYGRAYAIAALAWCSRRGVPSLMFSDSELLHTRSLPVQAGKRITLPALFRSISGFLTIGDLNEAYLAHYGVPRFRMFRTPLPTDNEILREARLKRADLRAAVRAELGIPENALVALFAGKLVARKRPLDIADAIRVLARTPDNRDVVAILAGDGVLRPALEAAAADLDGKLKLVGFVNQERDLPRLYMAADVYLHPAELHAHPVAVKEAVLCGLPVVTTDLVGSVGPTDDVRPGLNGRIHAAGDVHGLARILDDLRRRPEELTRMAMESEKIIPEIDLEASIAGFLRAVASVRAAGAQ